MTLSSWMQKHKLAKAIDARRSFWNKLFLSKLVFLEEENNIIPLNIETFRLSNSENFELLRRQLSKIASAVRTSAVCVSPLGNVTDFGEEEIGTISNEGFRIVWSKERVLPSIFEDGLTQRERDFIARLTIIPAISEIEEVGYCPLLHARLVSTELDPDKIVVISVVAPQDVRLEHFEKLRNIIRDLCKAEMIEFFDDGRFDSSMMVSIVIKQNELGSSKDLFSFIDTATIPLVKGIENAKTMVS